MGLSENWNVTGMYDKLRVEGMLLPGMSVKYPRTERVH